MQSTPDAAPKTLRRRLAAGSAWTISGRVGATAIALLVNVLVAELLTPTALGTYFVVTNLVVVTATVATLGMDTASIRLVASAVADGLPGRAGAVVIRTLAVAAAGGIVWGAVIAAGGWSWVASHVFSASDSAALGIVAGCLLLGLVFQNTVSAWFKGLQAMRAVAAFDGLLAASLFACGLLALRFTDVSATATQVVALRAGALATALAAAAWVLSRRVRARPLRGSGSARTREVVQLGSVLMLTTLISTVIGSTSDIVILGAFRPSADVAGYGVAATAAAAVGLPFAAGISALAPMIAELDTRGERRRLERLIGGFASCVAAPSVALTVVFVAVGAPILSFVFGATYASAAHVLVVLSVAQCVFVLTGPCGMTLIMTGHQKAAFALAAGGAVVCVVLDAWAASRWGAIGIAFATSSVVAADNIATTLLAKRLTGIWTYARFTRSDLRLAYTLIRATIAGRGAAAELLRH